MRRRPLQPALERCEARQLLATIIEVPRIAGAGFAVAAELPRWSPAIGNPNPVGPSARAPIPIPFPF